MHLGCLPKPVPEMIARDDEHQQRKQRHRPAMRQADRPAAQEIAPSRLKPAQRVGEGQALDGEGLLEGLVHRLALERQLGSDGAHKIKVLRPSFERLHGRERE